MVPSTAAGMRHATILFLAALGCVDAGSGIVGAAGERGDGGASIDGGFVAPSLDVSRLDIPPLDVPPLDARPLDAGPCSADRDCLRGRRCLQGRCVEDVCLAAEQPCGADRCEMRCVPTRDRCAGVTCAAGETCFAGRCIAGCFPSPCAGVTCPTGEYCDEGLGRCARVNPCVAPCDDGFTCHVACLPRTACDGVTCPSGQRCNQGACEADPCAGVSCAVGSLCVGGRCVNTCACDPPCNRSPRDRCLVGRCVCERTCTPTSRCGDDDGCGGRCVGTCANPNAACDPVSYTCDCVPRCGTTTSCGQDDGCGGRCAEGCAEGERCDPITRQCVCIPRCPPTERFSDVYCANPVPNLCPGGPVCGTGTGCPVGQRCSVNLNRCLCVGPECPPVPEKQDAGSGGDMDASVFCPVGLAACDGLCVDLRTNPFNCGRCRSLCPPGTTCVDSQCRCPGTTRLCGTRCVDTQTESGNCGGCGIVCGAGLACIAGRCQCDTACTVDLNAVDCGVEVPNRCPGAPSCGRGRRCASGQTCDPRNGRCVCVPRCPSGVACGTADGCGGQCVGTCSAGSSCAQDPMAPTRFFCSEASCAGGCRCDEVCANNRCVQLMCPFGGTPCPCQCCGPAEVCVGGARCEVIPP